MARVTMLMMAVLAICACGLSDSAKYDSPPADTPSSTKKMHRHRTTTPASVSANYDAVTATLPTIRKTSIAADVPLSSSAAPIPHSSFKCDNLEPGLYPAADGACKNSFYVCEPEADYALEFDCASPDTFFDVTSGFCLEKEYVSACGGIATTTTVQPLFVSSAIPFAFDCSNMEDGDYAQEEKCSKLYVSCSGGEAIYRNCPADTYFDIESGDCLEKEWVKVCGGESTTTILPTTVALDSSYDCSGKADGYYTSDSCSSLFYSCSGGQTRSMKCAGHASRELKFDVDSQMCLLKSYVPACGGQATTTTTNAPRASPLPEISCKDKAPGVYEDPTAQPTSAGGVCSSLYITCLPDAVDAIVSECPQGTKYDITVDQCQYDWNVTACGKAEKNKKKTPLADATEAAYTSRTTRRMKPKTTATTEAPATEASYTTKKSRPTRRTTVISTTTTELPSTTTMEDVPATEASYTTKAAKHRHHRNKTTTAAYDVISTTSELPPATEASYTSKKSRPTRRTTVSSTTTTELPSTTTMEDVPATEASYTSKKSRPTRRTTVAADVPSTTTDLPTTAGY